MPKGSVIATTKDKGRACGQLSQRSRGSCCIRECRTKSMASDLDTALQAAQEVRTQLFCQCKRSPVSM